MTFKAPARDGGAKITGYQVSVDRGRWRTISTLGRDPMRVRMTGLRDGRTYDIRIRAVNRVGSGPTSTVAVTPKSWIVDPVSARARRAEVGIPTDPAAYRGPLTNTTATDRSFYGTIAVPMNSLRGRPLRPLDAAVLSGPGLFAFNSAVLTAAGRRQVAAVAASLRGVKTATCEGYTDYGGEALHELQLSTARAKAVCLALTRDGAHVRTKALGYGQARPVVIGGTPAQRAGNRRVVIYLSS